MSPAVAEKLAVLAAENDATELAWVLLGYHGQRAFLATAVAAGHECQVFQTSTAREAAEAYVRAGDWEGAQKVTVRVAEERRLGEVILRRGDEMFTLDTEDKPDLLKRLDRDAARAVVSALLDIDQNDVAWDILGVHGVAWFEATAEGREQIEVKGARNPQHAAMLYVSGGVWPGAKTVTVTVTESRGFYYDPEEGLLFEDETFEISVAEARSVAP